MSFPKIVNQMGSFGEKRKKLFFRFCRPILDIFGFLLLSSIANSVESRESNDKVLTYKLKWQITII